MADGVTLATGNAATPANGTVVSTDDAGAAGHIQRVKLAYSADGVATHVTADANGLLVNVSDAFGLETTLQSIKTAVETLDNAISGSEMQVDVVSGSVVASGSIGIITVDNASPTTAAVGDSASSVTVLAASATRNGFSITNDSTAILYLKFGSTATTSSYIARMAQYDRFGDAGVGVFTGIITGIWASDAGGSAIVTSW